MAAIGDSTTGVNLLSSSSGGVGSSGSVLSKEVLRETSDAVDVRTARGGKTAFVTVMAAGGGRRTCVCSSMGVAE